MFKSVVEIHTLVNHSASVINRDRNNAPKTMIFGGVIRGRESSQCRKRNARLVLCSYFEKSAEKIMGTRTRNLPNDVWDILEQDGVSKDYKESVIKLLRAFGTNGEKEEKEKDKEKDASEEKTLTKQIMFYSPNEISAIAGVVRTFVDAAGSVAEFKKVKIKEVDEATKKLGLKPVSIDIALFGRMMSAGGLKTVEAAMQVAHSFSTHKAATETDFFAACDDEVDNGSAIIGDSEYTSCCYYGYCNIDIGQFIKNLETAPDAEDIVNRSIGEILRAFIMTRPTAKQSSFASYPMPTAVVIEMKEDRILQSYSDAFISPIKNTNDGNVVENSVAALVKHINRCDEAFDIKKKRFWFNMTDCVAPKANTTVFGNLNKMIDAVTDEIRK